VALRVWLSPQTRKLSLADYYSFQFITIQLRSDVKKRAGWSTLYIYIFNIYIYIYTHTHIYTMYIYFYIYMYMYNIYIYINRYIYLYIYIYLLIYVSSSMYVLDVYYTGLHIPILLCVLFGQLLLFIQVIYYR